ncbi:hypothetical protein J6590_008742 [Homalodisca vitripennis]|nr:hypothetical protein J6590_008742 [Homalodisca vitripennis]
MVRPNHTKRVRLNTGTGPKVTKENKKFTNNLHPRELPRCLPALRHLEGLTTVLEPSICDTLTLYDRKPDSTARHEAYPTIRRLHAMPLVEVACKKVSSTSHYQGVLPIDRQAERIHKCHLYVPRQIKEKLSGPARWLALLRCDATRLDQWLSRARSISEQNKTALAVRAVN